MAEAGAARYLRKDGWIKLYRSDAAFAATRARARTRRRSSVSSQRALERR